jgi:hypothetical protein
MAAIVSTRILALQATSPRIEAVPLPTNVTVDLSNVDQTLGSLAVGKLQGGTELTQGTTGALQYLKFGLGTAVPIGVNEAAVWGTSAKNDLPGGLFGNTDTAANSYGAITFTSSGDGASGASLFWGGLNLTTYAYTTAFVAGGGDTAGIAVHVASGNTVRLANGSYAIDATAGATRVQAFACNNATPQTAYALNAASTDLASVVALCNQIRTALINNGVCA